MPRSNGAATLVVEPEAIVFDCDGVLIDSDRSVVAAWTAWALARDLDPSDVIAICHGQPARATVGAFVNTADADAALGDIDRLELDLAGEARALPGAIELLRALPEGRWGLCTSGNRSLASARIAASGIELPRVFITADDVAWGKPDPEGYALALARLGADPTRSVVVEDAPNGVAAARAAGVGTVIGVGERAVGADIDAAVADLRGVRWHRGRLVVRATDPVA